MKFTWPDGFLRYLDEPWATADLETLALKYDSVEQHGWYSNLDLSVEQIADGLNDGDVLIDYSGGTGILLDRVFTQRPGLACGAIIADSSPKFLRLALSKTGVLEGPVYPLRRGPALGGVYLRIGTAFSQITLLYRLPLGSPSTACR